VYDVVTTKTPHVQPPTDWVDQLDAAIERENEGTGGPLPADLVAGWLAWYAGQLREAHEAIDTHRTIQRWTEQRLNRATRLGQQLTEIIVSELGPTNSDADDDQLSS
jgi:hypothetical protein